MFSTGTVLGTLFNAVMIAAAWARFSTTGPESPLPCVSVGRIGVSVCVLGIDGEVEVMVGVRAGGVCVVGVRGGEVEIGVGVRVGEGGGDGRVFGEVFGQGEVAFDVGAVEAVAYGDEVGGVAGAEVGGVAGFVEAGQELEAVGLGGGDGALQRVESGQQFAATLHVRRSHLREFHAANSRQGRRQFLRLKALIDKGIG